MKDPARLQAAAEILESVFSSEAPADKIIGAYFREHRYAGAKDKGFIASLVYHALRNLGLFKWRTGSESPRLILATALADMGEVPEKYFDSSKHSLPALSAEEKTALSRAPETEPEHVALSAPLFLMSELKKAFPANLKEEMEALNAAAPLDLRVNTLKSSLPETLEWLVKNGFDATPSGSAIRIPARKPIFGTDIFKRGFIEVQDKGSQETVVYTEAKAGGKVIDFCAGAGGKTLALAAQMKNKGSILALDISAAKLAELKKRVRRAGVDNARIKLIENENDKFLKRHLKSADLVVADVPCSGSGTWRRNPDLKWKLTAEKLSNLISLQAAILESAANLLKPGGRLVYITCSILPSENEEQINRFLLAHKNFTLQKEFLKLSPYKTGTDGFFAASLIMEDK